MSAADRRWHALGELAAEGIVCVMCGQALLVQPVAQVKVGVDARTGLPVYACERGCADFAGYLG